MKIYFKIILVIVVLAALGGIFFISKPLSPKSSAVMDEEEISSLLKKDVDTLAYINKYPEFKIEDKIVLSKEDVIKGQAGQNFKEVYQDLGPESGRYMKLDLINGQGDRGLIVVIDLKEQKVLKSFEIIKIGIGG